VNKKIRINSVVALNEIPKTLGIVKDIKIDITNGQRIAIVQTATKQQRLIPISDLSEFTGMIHIHDSWLQISNDLISSARAMGKTLEKLKESRRINHGH